MSSPKSSAEILQSLDQVLGYINFSSGSEDTKFLSTLDRLFDEIAAETESRSPNSEPESEDDSKENPAKDNPKDNPKDTPKATFLRVHDRLHARLEKLSSDSEAFSNCQQAQAVLNLVFKKMPAAYRAHHRNLLFHQQPELLFNSFFMGRIVQAVLQTGGPWEETQQVIEKSIGYLNQFLGHRQLATLHTQKIEPYENEWVGPTPIYIKGAGVACGQYQPIIQVAIDVINETDPEILRSAGFDPENLDELCVDPRAFDFDHPIN